MLRGVKERDIGAHELETLCRTFRLERHGIRSYRLSCYEKKREKKKWLYYIFHRANLFVLICICDTIVRKGLSFNVVPSRNARIRFINARFRQQCSILI